jgi:hypothetical protein
MLNFSGASSLCSAEIRTTLSPSETHEHLSDVYGIPHAVNNGLVPNTFIVQLIYGDFLSWRLISDFSKVSWEVLGIIEARIKHS